MKFSYSARTMSGMMVEGSVDADDKIAAIRAIERLGHVPVTVQPANRETSTAAPAQVPPPVRTGPDSPTQEPPPTIWTNKSPSSARFLVIGACVAMAVVISSIILFVPGIRSRLLGDQSTSYKTLIRSIQKKIQMESNSAEAECLGKLLAHIERLNAGGAIDNLDEDGSTALLVAAREGDVDAVRVLLGNGAGVDVQSVGGYVVKGVSLNGENVRIIWRLMGLKPLSFSDDGPIYSEKGWTALMAASQNNDDEIVALLIHKGATVDATGDRQGRTALMLAVESGYTSIVKLLLNGGARADATDSKGRTPLTLASMNGHAKVVELILNTGMKVDSLTADGWTPLMVASMNGQEDVVRLLIDKGANVNARCGTGGYTAMSLALEGDHTKVVAILNKHGAR